MIGPRLARSLRSGALTPASAMIMWLFRSREIVNFTYETTRLNQLLLCNVVALIADRAIDEVVQFLDELGEDRELHEYVREAWSRSESKWMSDEQFRPGKRLAYYLLVRALKPGMVVEAGVDHGFGAMLIAAALRRNRDEGFDGNYQGIEFSARKRCHLFDGYPRRVGEIVRGDSTQVLGLSATPIDLFIHDTIREPNHIRDELQALKSRIHERSVIVSAWPTAEFTDFARNDGWTVLTHQDDVIHGWPPGTRLAFVFRPRTAV